MNFTPTTIIAGLGGVVFVAALIALGVYLLRPHKPEAEPPRKRKRTDQ